MSSKNIKKSYAAIFPSNGLMVISQEYDDKRNIIEHNIPIASSDSNIDEMDKMFFKAVSKLDNTVAGVCFFVSDASDKMALNNVAKLCFIKNFEVVEICIIESFDVISQSPFNLEYNKIIWTCLNNYCCIWNGPTCTTRKYDFGEKLFEGLLVTTEYPPDVIIFEASSEKYFDKNIINELHPACKIYNTCTSPDQRNEKMTALNYAKQRYKDGLNLNVVPTIARKATCQKDDKVSKTDIHVGISLVIDTVSAMYYLNGKEREFSFKINKSLTSGKQREEIEENLKTAAARINGIFGCICIVYPLTAFPNTEFDERWAMQWAIPFGFQKAEVIDKRKAEYLEMISQLSLETKRSDVIWISSSYNNYEIWKDYTFQINILVTEIKKNPPAQKYFPNYIIFKDQSWKTYREAALKTQFPECQFLFCNCQHTYKTMLKYAQMMAEGSIDKIEMFNNEKPPKVPKHSPLNTLNRPHVLKPPGVKNQATKESTKSENPIFEKAISTSHKKVMYEFPNQITINNDQISATGIDLGTSRCCAAVNRRNGIYTVPLDNTGERLLPSYVAYDEENVKCGNVALNRLRHFFKSTVFDSKRIIGRSINDIDIDSNWPFTISHEENKVIIEVKRGNICLKKTAEEVAADLLRNVKQRSDEFQGKKLTDVVITVPAAFSNDQKEATIQAAKLAGWEKVALLPEPVAAAFAYFNERPIPNNSNVLVYDLGGGTLDVCIFVIKNNGINIVSNAGDTKLGGRDFDTVLFNHFKNQLLTEHGITLIKDKKYKLILDCQKIKENLSTASSCILDVTEYNPEKHQIISITREKFQNITKPLLNRIRYTLLSALHDSKFKENEINKVLLVGGGSRMPMVKNLLLEIFPDAEQCCDDNPDEVVAMGAAYYAYSQQQQQKNDHITSYDIPPSLNCNDTISTRYDVPPLHDSSQQFHQQPTTSTSTSAIALFDYDANDKITDIEKIDEGWWRGKCSKSGKTGVFPANYVIEPPLYDPSKSSAAFQQFQHQSTAYTFSYAVALFDYVAHADNEIGFKLNDEITVIKEVDSNWLYGKCNVTGKFGIFPASYVRLI